MRIISASERLAEKSGPKILIAGPPKIGKTSLLRTVNPKTTLFVDLEAGSLAVQDVPCDTLRPRTWAECRDLACFLGGPNPGLDNEENYSAAHYEHVRESFVGVDLDKYDLIFVDSITEAARVCISWCKQQPAAFSDKTGKPDPRGMYGLLGRELIDWMKQLQHAREKAVVLVCILENVKDEVGRPSWELQIDGQKAGRELPGIVDEIITLQLIKVDEDSPPERYFVCHQNNPEKYPAGDRSGRLEMLEPASLGDLLAKLTATPSAEPRKASSKGTSK